jgi:hypothetical protein
MKISKMIMTVGLLAAMGFSGVVSAHDYIATLGRATTATDKWYITRAAGTAKITYQIMHTSGTGCVQIAPYFPVGPATRSCGGYWSPLITVATGAGAKLFTINKNPATLGALSYTVRINGYDANGVQNPDDQSFVQTYIQNQ